MHVWMYAVTSSDDVIGIDYGHRRLKKLSHSATQRRRQFFVFSRIMFISSIFQL